ncbi:hypothetical protein L3X38_033609 [Prunus dulcis]|uniref:Uncharacterized protein n=1 Tax=Prunus dulcis TaxID=3755 RepID=A0AAD4VHB5_PRUDU|nr:hypothetical protein L3X38_033609 [Prunus dulcis]
MLKKDGKTESSAIMVCKAPTASFSFPRPTPEEEKNMHYIYCNENCQTKARCFNKNGFSEWFLECQKQCKVAHEKKKNGGSGVAVVIAVGQSSVCLVASATQGVSTLPTTASSVDDSLTVLLSYPFQSLLTAKWENTIKELHNWFEIEIQGKEAQNSGLEPEPLNSTESSQAEQDISDLELDSSEPLLSNIPIDAPLNIPKIGRSFSRPKIGGSNEYGDEGLTEEWNMGKQLVGCRWVYTVNHKADGTIDR